MLYVYSAKDYCWCNSRTNFGFSQMQFETVYIFYIKCRRQNINILVKNKPTIYTNIARLQKITILLIMHFHKEILKIRSNFTTFKIWETIKPSNFTRKLLLSTLQIFDVFSMEYFNWNIFLQGNASSFKTIIKYSMNIRDFDSNKLCKVSMHIVL